MTMQCRSLPNIPKCGSAAITDCVEEMLIQLPGFFVKKQASREFQQRMDQLVSSINRPTIRLS